MKKMKVFGVPSWYVSSKNQISGVFFKEQFEYLNSTLCMMVVLSVNLLSIKSYNGIPRITKTNHAGVPTYTIDIYCPPGSIFKYLAWSIGILFLYLKACSDYGKPDLIHAHSTLWAGAGVRFTSLVTKTPYIITEHATIYSQPTLSKIEKFIVQQALRNCASLICVSERLRKDISPYTKSAISVLPNMVNIDQFELGPHIPEEPFIIFSAGMLIKRKNFDTLIRGFSESKQHIPNLILKIAGSGPEREKLDDLISELDLRDSVIMMGELGRQEIIKEMQNSHIFISSSSHETFGVVIIEAMACGRPCISTKSGGPEEIIISSNGILIDKPECEMICNSIVEIYKNYDRYDSEAIREYIVGNYSQKNVAGKIFEVYKKVLNG